MTEATDVSVWLTAASVEVSQLAGRLGGICTEERENVAGIEQVFRFNMESFANQFNFSAFHFPEVISIGRSPNLSKKAIADSRLCDCGWTTKRQCDLECESQELAVAARLGGDRDSEIDDGLDSCTYCGSKYDPESEGHTELDEDEEETGNYFCSPECEANHHRENYCGYGETPRETGGNRNG